MLHTFVRLQFQLEFPSDIPQSIATWSEDITTAMKDGFATITRSSNPCPQLGQQPQHTCNTDIVKSIFVTNEARERELRTPENNINNSLGKMLGSNLKLNMVNHQAHFCITTSMRLYNKHIHISFCISHIYYK